MIRLTLAALLLAGMARAEPSVFPVEQHGPDCNAGQAMVRSERPGVWKCVDMEDRSWHLLQRQYDGLIRSVQHGFTKHECEFAVARARGEPATDEEWAVAAKAKAEREVADNARVAKDKADQAKWEGEHPGCDYVYPATGDVKGCPTDRPGGHFYLGTASAVQWAMSAHSSTDIVSAECFQ